MLRVEQNVPYLSYVSANIGYHKIMVFHNMVDSELLSEYRYRMYKVDFFANVCCAIRKITTFSKTEM